MSANSFEGEEEPDVTPEMIEAGRRALWDSGLLPIGEEGGSSEIVAIRKIFLEMLAAHKPA